MKKITLLLIFACINVLFAILLIHKQNNIITLLYDIQQLQEERDSLLEKKKDLNFQLQKEQQLSNIQSFASESLQMKPLKIKEAKTISVQKKDSNNGDEQ